MSVKDPAIRVLVKAAVLEQAMGVLGLGSWVLQSGRRGQGGLLAQFSQLCPDRMKMTAHLQGGWTGAATM